MIKEFPFSGDMSERINIVDYGSTVQDGELVPTETVSSAIPAMVEFSNGIGKGEQNLGDQLYTVEDVNFYIRYDSTITTKKKVRWNGEDRDIRRIAIIGRNRYLKIITREHGN
jgi:SPP1 family predicted phage head-tail adaptor